MGLTDQPKSGMLSSRNLPQNCNAVCSVADPNDFCSDPGLTKREVQIWIFNKKLPSFLNLLFRICFVKIQIVLFNSQNFVINSGFLVVIFSKIIYRYLIYYR